MQKEIITQFSVYGRLLRLRRFGSGLINETFLCECGEHGYLKKYLLQRINMQVFKQPEDVMANIETVIGHIQQQMQHGRFADYEIVMPSLVRTRSGRAFHVDENGGWWRMFDFIESGDTFDTVQGPGHAFEIGRALGRFQALLSDLDPSRLFDTLPGFHNTPRYFKELDAAVAADARGRVAEAQTELEFAEERRTLAPVLVDLINNSVVPIRVVHNDPKVNNVLIHRETGKALCLVDLDTVKPGIVAFDFGDCVRSAANPAGEDADSLADVRFDLASYEAIREGYLKDASCFLTPEERASLPLSVKIITLELGIRFLADYIRGDAYFRIGYPDHNLHRARVQFKLLECMEQAGI